MRPLRALLSILVLSGWLPWAWAIDVGPANGIRFSQVSFPAGSPVLNTPIGWMQVDLNTLRNSTGILSGFLNVSTSGGWVVRNLPVVQESTYPYAGINTKFNLGVQTGTAVTQLSAAVDYSPTLLTSYSGTSFTLHSVDAVNMNIGGAGTGTGTPALSPDLTTILFSDPSKNDTIIQYDHPNIETAANQCAPMSIANSLKYLSDTQGLQLPHTHKPGIKGDDSLVGQLDTAGDRTVTDREHGVGQWLVKTKLNYLAKHNLTGRIVTSHWGTYGPESGASAMSVTVGGVTATAAGKGGKLNVDQIMDAMKEGQNCEMVYSFPQGGAHAVDLVGIGKHNGQPWVMSSSDLVQAGQGADLADSDSRGAGREGLEFEYLGTPDANGVYTGSTGHRIVQMVCEKYIPPPATVTVTDTQDPAGHSCCVPPPPATATLTVNGSSVTMTGTATWLPLSGTVNVNGSFTLAGTATVAFCDDVLTTFTGTLQGSNYVGALSVGANGKLPGGQPIIFNVSVQPPLVTANAAMRVNGYRHVYAARSGELLRPSVSLKAGSQAGTMADWWLLGAAGGQFYHFNLATMSWQPGLAATHSGPLSNIPFFELPYLGLPSGTYDFYFGFDTTADGELTMPSLVYETTRVTVQ